MNFARKSLEDTGDLANEVEASVGLQVKRQRIKKEKEDKKRKRSVYFCVPSTILFISVILFHAPHPDLHELFWYAFMFAIPLFFICWQEIFAKQERGGEKLRIIDRVGLVAYCFFYIAIISIGWWQASLHNIEVSLVLLYSSSFLFVGILPCFYFFFVRIQQRHKRKIRLMFVSKAREARCRYRCLTSKRERNGI